VQILHSFAGSIQVGDSYVLLRRPAAELPTVELRFQFRYAAPLPPVGCHSIPTLSASPTPLPSRPPLRPATKWNPPTSPKCWPLGTVRYATTNSASTS
jgi:hypothetical protein